MTRAKERGEGFRVAQVQQKRADRADERIAELRRELMATNRSAEYWRSLAVNSEQSLDVMMKRAHLAEQGWQLEAHLRREHEAEPLWRIAARRLQAFFERNCQ